MFINKISGGSSNLNNKTFKGYEYVKNDYGKTVHHFYYPYDSKHRNAYLDFYKVKEDPNEFNGFVIDREAGVKTYKLDKETLSKEIDVDRIFDLKPGEYLAYQIRVDYETPKPDTGMQFDAQKYADSKKPWETFTLLPKTVTKPMTKNGLGALVIADTHKPGAFYHGFESDRTGEVDYSEELQKEREQIKRTSANKIGGSLAGIEHDIPNLKKKGITTLFATPIAGYDTLYYHRYHNQNNFQIADEIGNIDNFETFAIKMFKNGMTYVFDGTFTSEGSEGADVQYAQKWAHEDPDALYRFRFQGLDDGPIGYGIIPKNKENTRYKLVNSPYILAKADNGKVEVVKNNDYNKRKPTYVQIYDVTMVTEEQANSNDLITSYASPVTTKDKLAVNTYQDVTVPQKNQIYDLAIFKTTLENAADYINTAADSKEINTPEIAMLVAQAPGFQFSQKSKNATLWENKEGLFSRNHGFSGNDEKILMSIPSEIEREVKRNKNKKGGIQNIDEDVQVVSYWTGVYKDDITYYIARTLKGAKTVEDIEKLIKAGELPEQVRLSAKALQNIEKEIYYLEPKGVLDRNEVTVKALMKLPLPSLEFAENTVSVLKQGFFFNRASEDYLIGKTRYELDLMGNPQLSDIERDIYERTNNLFRQDVKNFADAIIERINAQSEEKLIDENGEYTEYGEYVIEHIGPRIAKYAFLKSLVGNKFIGNYVKSMPNGDIKYNYVGIRNITTLEDLEIPSNSMISNASALQNRIQNGMKSLNINDVEFMSQAFVKQLKGSTVMDFRIAEAQYDKSSLGLDWRIDALKDVKDIDAVKELSETFYDFWDEVISYYQKLTNAITEKNPGSKTFGEITDMDATIRRTSGTANINTREDRDGVEVRFFDRFDAAKEAGAKYPDETIAMRDFWIKSGIVSEANYSDFFTSIIRTLAQDYEDGVSEGSIWNVIRNLQKMVAKRGVDYMRNLFTFDGNHDKPRVVHFAALDMELFHNDFGFYKKVNGNMVYNITHNQNYREKAMEILLGTDSFSELPLEIKLNINNADYFRTVSSESVAMCNSLKIGVNEAINKGVIKTEDKKHFLKALADLAEGKYLGYGTDVSRKTIQLDELQKIDSVIEQIINNAQQNHGLSINEETKKQMIKTVCDYATDKNLKEFSVVLDQRDIISQNIDWIFEGQVDHEQRKADKEYSSYVAKLLAFTKKAFEATYGNNKEYMEAFKNSAIDFINKYDQKYINEHSSAFPYHETYQNADRKNGFGNSEFEETVTMLIEQAEYIAGKKFENSEEILKTIYMAIHEPAMEKSVGMAALLAAVVGIPTELWGDARGQSGGEWKNNNVQNQNRNVVHRLKYQMLDKYRDKIEANYDKARNIRNIAGAEALNTGTPYMLHFKDNIGAWLMQSKDSMTVTIMTGEGINRDFRGKRDENISNTLNEIIFPEGLLLEAGTEFECITSSGKIKAFIEHFQYNNQGKWFAKLIGQEGANLLDKNTVKNGITVFKRVAKEQAENIAKTAKSVSMRGRNGSQQYYISTPVYNTYNIQQKTAEGQNLSILCK